MKSKINIGIMHTYHDRNNLRKSFPHDVACFHATNFGRMILIRSTSKLTKHLWNLLSAFSFWFFLLFSSTTYKQKQFFSNRTKPIKKNEWKKLHFLQIIIPEPTDCIHCLSILLIHNVRSSFLNTIAISEGHPYLSVKMTPYRVHILASQRPPHETV